MSRERVITRTIVENNVTVLAMDIVNAKAVEKTIVYTGPTKDNTEVIKAVKKIYDTPEFSIVAIKGIETVEVLYGMSEVDFIKYAKRMENRFEKIK